MSYSHSHSPAISRHGLEPVLDVSRRGLAGRNGRGKLNQVPNFRDDREIIPAGISGVGLGLGLGLGPRG